MRKGRCALALTAAVLGSGLAWATKLDKVLERQTAVMTQVKELVLKGKPAEALPLAEQIIAENEQRYAGEKKRIFSGQSLAMIMANMLGASATASDAIDAGPPYGEAVFFKGYILIDLGRGDEARAFLDRAVSLSPSNPQFLCEAGNWYAEHHQAARGLELFQQCEDNASLANDQPFMRARAARGKGYSLIELGRLDEAEAIYRKRLADDPKDEKAAGELRYIEQQRTKAPKNTA
jgi:tetratricopeptide (TPR) repeat protein